MKRRTFLKNTTMASTALMVPSFLHSFNFNSPYRSRTGKILVIVQLSGGNDGLNTVVPYENDIYYRSRPNIKIEKDKVLKLNDQLGFNPAMAGMRDLYDEGLLSIVNNVGYPNPDRSHFRSMDIWHTASNSDEYLSYGWLGRYLDSNCEGCTDPYHAMEVDDSLSLVLKGEQRSGFAMSNPNQLLKMTKNRLLKGISQMHHEDHDHEEVAYLYKVLRDTQNSAEYLHDKSKVYKSNVSYPNTPFGKDLKQTAELITADTATQVYYLSLGGFDTHANQQARQERLLKQYADGMKAFVKDLKQNGLLNDTLIMTFSEFGRRVSQNASKGTDHGTANNLYLIGGSLKNPGFFNNGPDLSKLEKGDLIYKVDFRNVYATILKDWLKADAPTVLGQNFKAMNLLT